MSAGRDAKLERLGWALFTACAVAFLVSSVRERDPFAVVGSLLFLAADACFLAVVLRRHPSSK